MILAAGASRRAGSVNKLLHPIAGEAGEAMIRRVARVVVAAGLEPRVVVLGHESTQIRAVLDDLPLDFVVNEAHAQGIGSSIAAGIAALAADPEIDAAAIVLGDMPKLRVVDLDALRAAYGSSAGDRIIAPEAGEGPGRRLGNPIVWPRPYFEALAKLRGDTGARHILEASAEAVIRVPIDHPGVLLDFDHVEPERESESESEIHIDRGP